MTGRALRAAPFAPEPGRVEPGPVGDGPDLRWVRADLDSRTRRFAASLLDPAEAARARSFRSRDDADAYTATHAALRLLLGARLGMPPERVPIVPEPCPTCGRAHGRPRLAGGEAHFSISHRRGIGLVAIGPRRLGVDVEARLGTAAAAALAGLLHPRETAELDALDEPALSVSFTRLWVRKEAYLKGLGVGLARPLSADYLGAGPSPAQPDGWTVRDVLIDGGHPAALAVADR